MGAICAEPTTCYWTQTSSSNIFSKEEDLYKMLECTVYSFFYGRNMQENQFVFKKQKFILYQLFRCTFVIMTE